MAPPLTADLWALGMLLAYLFVGVTVFPAARYVSIASDGHAAPTEDTRAAAPSPCEAEQLGRARLEAKRAPGVGGFLSGVLAKSKSVVTAVFERRASPEPAAAAQPPELPPQAAPSLLRSPQSIAERIQHDAALSQAVSAAQERAEAATTIEEMVANQVDLLRTAGASQGAIQRHRRPC